MSTALQCIVYVLKNSDDPPRFYTGLTADLGARLAAHNAGRCSHTAKHRPWAVDLFVTFTDERRALRFEKYLKSGSGVEFARRHLR
jgi:putative endonuclease